MSKTSRLHEQNLENTSTGIKISAGPEVKGVTPKLVGIEGKLVLHVLSIYELAKCRDSLWEQLFSDMTSHEGTCS